MSLFGTMKTGVSGLSAQASKLGTVGDNIANVDTAGYKRASMEFASLVLHSDGGEYASGAVQQDVRYGITQRGAIESSASATDLAIDGNGFFVVADASGRTFLTRSGAFVPNDQGELINSAGLKLLGYPASVGGAGVPVNSTASLVPIKIGDEGLQAVPSKTGLLTVNLPEEATAVAAADLPSANGASATSTAGTSIVAYDNLGSQVTLDVFMTKVAANQWEIAVYDRSQAASGGGFPYASGPLSVDTVDFDPTNGGHILAGSTTDITIPVPNGAPLTIDIGATSQLDSDFSVVKVGVDGNSAAAVDHVEVGRDGTFYSVYENNARVATYQIALAKVASPDQLRPESGTTFSTTIDSGDVQIGKAGDSGLGTIASNALEASTVDIANELTTMIEAQRSYTANSKVVQTSSELLDVLVNLKR